MVRTEKIRRPDLLIKCGPTLLEKHRGKVNTRPGASAPCFAGHLPSIRTISRISTVPAFLPNMPAVRLLGMQAAKQVHRSPPVRLTQSRRSVQLGNGIWDVREQVFLAALDLHLFKIARTQLDALVVRFPTSARVKVLEGMMFECQVCHSTQRMPSWKYGQPHSIVA
jgi:hypothetical protein